MKHEARKLWKSRPGGVLLAQMLRGQPLTPDSKQLLNKLKRVEPASKGKSAAK